MKSVTATLALFFALTSGGIVTPALSLDEDAVASVKQHAEEGNENFQFILGSMYYFGKWIAKDYKKSAKWYQLAAEQGHARAQNRLGQLYYFGEGVTQSYKESAKWYQLAAEQGITEAQTSLGAMYLSGHGVPRNYREAYIWFSIAGASYEDGLITFRQAAEEELTSIERYQAQDEALKRVRQIEAAQKQ